MWRMSCARLAAAQGRTFAISEPVTTAAGVDPAAGDKVTLRRARLWSADHGIPLRPRRRLCLHRTPG